MVLSARYFSFAGLALTLLLTFVVNIELAHADESGVSGAEGVNATGLESIYTQGTPPAAPNCPVGETPIMWFQPDTGYFFSGSCQFTGCPAGYQQQGQSCVTHINEPCSGSNQCGTLYGTIQPDGRCSVGGPTLPVTYGWDCTSSENSCHMRNTGTIGCDGSTCQASPPGENMCHQSTPHGCGPGTLNDTCTCEQLGNCPIFTTPHGCGPGTLNDTCTPPPPCETISTYCGMTSTYNMCTGTFVTTGTYNCSITTAPASAGWQCWSAPNSCGQTTEGVIQWSGLCNASPPSEAGCSGAAAPAPAPEPEPIPTTCAPGYHVSGSSCVFYTCPVGFKRTGQSTCVFTSCPSGYTQHGQSCTPNSCPATLYYCGVDSGIGNLYKETYSSASCTPYDTLSQRCDYGCDAAHGVCNASPDIDASINARPQIVRSGNTTLISWQAFQVSSCTITAGNGDSWSCTARQCENGSHLSSVLTAQTTYMLSCAVPAQPNIVKNVIVNIIPVFQEQ